jgi:phosphoribosylanthranilate isomerase
VNPTVAPRVKVCCIASVEEARLAIAHGASAIGLVSEMPSGPGVIPEPLIAEIAAGVPPAIDTFLLTCRPTVAGIVAQQRRARVNTIQVCDDLPSGGLRELRAALPGVRVVQVVHVDGEEAIARAEAAAPDADAILLDSGNQRLAVKELGGTGRRHDWAISRRIRERVDVPVYLAGGLQAGNVAEAIATVGPYALDVCGGVRSEGRLDAARLGAFFDAVRKAAATGPARRP